MFGQMQQGAARVMQRNTITACPWLACVPSSHMMEPTWNNW